MPDNSSSNSQMPITREDLRRVDSSYKPFPPFSKWSNLVVDTGRWEAYAGRVREKGGTSPDLLGRARNVAKRAAAVDTGAIEGLYDVDRGFTFTVATESALWETALAEKGENVRALIDSQLRAYDHVIDLATKATPVAEAWIREIHSVICASQATYTVYTEIGLQEQSLPLGEYKHHANHVRGRDGKIHAYAPVDVTPAEMHRLCEELRSEAFEKAHPVLQASYAHYALVAVHPFADGNGRVARALASVYTYRAQSVPLLVLFDTRGAYYEALMAADGGQFQEFVDFVLERSLDGMLLVEESLRAAAQPDPATASAALQRLYVTRGGYTHAQVDEAGYRLVEGIQKELQTQAVTYSKQGEVAIQLTVTSTAHTPVDGRYRASVTQGNRGLSLSFISAPPASARVDRNFVLEVPKDCGRDDDLIVRDLGTTTVFQARISELMPSLSTSVLLRVRMFAASVTGKGLDDLGIVARQALRGRGYA